jgi:hypothetical protein
MVSLPMEHDALTRRKESIAVSGNSVNKAKNPHKHHENALSNPQIKMAVLGEG